ncbi:Emp24/gp25L/p24 family protein [Necator americanus]|uniref:Emp24/gp25L/p24 family protein n=1 Tax=Necator americanus TaxID=51031 RepID=W2T0G1_NECAM|nr:Emp24/gp25L/p24 family protein [Necator americanus]ETN74736.1 Emp24/gp25L/p24 family protein [Necator americanus]
MSQISPHIVSKVYAQQAEAAVPESERRGPQSAAELAEDQRAQDDDSDVIFGLTANPEIAPASLWNRKDIVEFKNTIKKEGSEGIIKVGHGETVTVRVPTHEEGTCLFWEFATDYYDIGFGVYFEWTIADSNQVSIHVSESDEEDEYDETNGEGGEGETPAIPGNPAVGDVESGGGPHRRIRDPNKPRQDEIIPVYRRDCHEEVGINVLQFSIKFSLEVDENAGS